MRKKEKEKLREKITKYIEEAKKDLWCRDWSVDVIFFDDRSDSSGDSSFEIKWDLDYYRAELSICNKMAKYLDGKKRLRETIYHEISHLVIAELVTASHTRYISQNHLDSIKEKTTERIKNIFLFGKFK